MVKGVIFDADGTLLLSMKFWDSMVTHLISCSGVEPCDGLTEILASMSMKEGAEYLQKEYGVLLSTDEIVKQENEMVEEFYTKDVKLRSGVKDVLGFLKSNNVKMAVATATDAYLIVKALEHLGISDCFEKVISCSDVGEGKSSPKVYFSACRILGTVPDETVVAEDNAAALKTAKNAGFKTIGVYDSDNASNFDSLFENSDFLVTDVFDVSVFKALFTV